MIILIRRSWFINVDTSPKFYCKAKVEWIIRLIARLINLLQRLRQQTDISGKQFQQKGIFVALVALSLSNTLDFYISRPIFLSSISLFLFICFAINHTHIQRKI